ncbi:MAG: hypothetical protein HOW73_26905 [Polyangiaceae bacterium]|nr:hypothetical protein [Polyangiaceae bacterium]
MTFQRSRLLGRVVPVLVIVASAGCNDQEPTDTDPGLYTLRLDHYETTEPPGPLDIANETLMLPLGRGAVEQELTREAPGDLVVAYTRIGCDIDDLEGHIGSASDEISAGPFVRLREISIEQVSTGVADQTCFSYRSRDGSWHAQIAPTSVDDDGEIETSTLVLDADEVDAVAIFLPTYTEVTGITYRLDDH